MKTYKLRAEAPIDAINLMDALRNYEIDNKTGHEKDKIRFIVETDWHSLSLNTEVEFQSRLNLKTLQRICHSVVDGHVMAETIALASDYTGDRV